MLRVTVLGGGPAAAELLLALRALAEERVALELITPRPELPLRAASTGAAFGAGTVEVYDLAELCEDVGAALRVDTAEAVAPRVRRIRLASGATSDYDALVVAVGARARSAIPGATVFRDQRDAALLDALRADLAHGNVRSVAFAAPAGVAWTLPLYELALLTAKAGPAEVTLATPERRALEVFGPEIGARVEALLTERGVWLRTGAVASADRADRVIAVPRLVGRRVAGVPTDWNAFIPTDRWGRVREVEDIYAAGDVSAFPVKQGGLATQQADVIAGVLAKRSGAPVALSAPRHVLRARLLGLERPLYLRAELDGSGRLLSTPSASEEPPWWPGAKLFGRHLTPWMARHAAAHEETLAHG